MSYWADSMVLWSGQALLLVIALAVAAALLRRRSAADRHLLWLIGLLAIAGLPLANMVIAALPVATPVVETFRYVIPHSEPWTAPPAQQSVGVGPVKATKQESTSISWQPRLPAALFVAWVGGVLISLVRPVQSYLDSHRLRAGASVTTISAFRLLAGHSAHVRAPMLAGIFRPMILLPADIATWAHPEEQHAMVLHEAAHFERRDHLVNLFQTFLRAFLFFHPAVRYAVRQLLLERELACDEHVLQAGVRPATYGEALLKVAERSLTTRHSLEPAFHTSGRILERRMTMILNHQPSTLSGSRVLRGFCVVATLTVAALLLPERAVTSGVRLAIPMVVAGAPALSMPAAVVPPQVATPPATSQVQVPVGVGRLSGTISDQSGAVIPGVEVVLIDRAQDVTQRSVTAENGAYAFPRVNSGAYTLEARLPGFVTHSRTIVMSGPSLVANAVLLISPVSTQVEVSVGGPAGAPTGLSATGTTPAQQFPVRVGGDISAPNLVSQVAPVYPPLARANQVQAPVRLLAVIGTDGTVVSVRPDPAHPIYRMDLLNAAIDAVKQWRYRPGILNGVPVEFMTTITVNFTIS